MAKGTKAATPPPEETADTVAAGAIEGAGAALEAGGDARDVAAAAIGGAAAATAEATGSNEAAPAEEAPAEDHITAFERNLARLERIAEEADFESGSLVGDIRDALLDLFRARLKPWAQMSAGEQADTNRGLESMAKTLLRKLVRVVAEQDDVSVHATLKGYAVDGDTFKLKVVAKGDAETAAELFNMDGHEVIMIRADARQHFGQRRDGEVIPDQPGLRFEGEEGTAASISNQGSLATTGDVSLGHQADDSDLAGPEDEDEEDDREGEAIEKLERVNLKTGMVEWIREDFDRASVPEGDPFPDEAFEDVREATAEELAAERERTADFSDA